jgi:hypothetical protein
LDPVAAGENRRHTGAQSASSVKPGDALPIFDLLKPYGIYVS